MVLKNTKKILKILRALQETSEHNISSEYNDVIEAPPQDPSTKRASEGPSP